MERGGMRQQGGGCSRAGTPAGESAPASESALVSQILLEIGSRPDVRLWRSQPLAARGPSGRVIRALPKGHPDLTGIVRCERPDPITGQPVVFGRALYIECKSATGRVRPEQQKFADMLLLFGAIYVLARSVDDVRRALPALALPPEPRA